MRHDYEFCPNCDGDDTEESLMANVLKCNDCGCLFEGSEFDNIPKQIRVKKPYRPTESGDPRD
jgi:transcription initiation factor TFIIIB Brf1 subunit/transcription initiation factor TFIIB